MLKLSKQLMQRVYQNFFDIPVFSLSGFLALYNSGRNDILPPCHYQI